MSRLTLESILYLLAFLVALFFRLIALGALPLAAEEAVLALQALGLSEGSPAAGFPHPGYVSLTGLLFFLSGSSDFAARQVPALAGALLVFLPWFFRERKGRDGIGRSPALILAFLLAVDPGLAAVSRLVGGPALALSLTLLAAGAFYAQMLPLAGVLGGLALLSGPVFWHGLLVLAVSWILVRLFESLGLIDESRLYLVPSRRRLAAGAAWLAGTFLLVGMLFLRYPQGIGGFAASLPEYLSAWVSRSGVSALRLPAALLVYQPLGVLLGGIAVVRAWMRRLPEDAFAQRLSLFFLAALLLGMLHPGRQAADLVWALVPLLALAAVELHRRFTPMLRRSRLTAALVQAALTVVILAYAWNFLANLTLANEQRAASAFQFLAFLVVGTLSMLGVVFLLSALGWGVHAAARGLAWGIIAALSIYGFASLWGSIGLNANPRWELWTSTPAPGEPRLLTDTLHGFSLRTEGMGSSLDVAVLADTPSLRWQLRDWREAEYLLGLEPGRQPSALISFAGQEPPQAAAEYTGQDFIFERSPRWDEISSSGLVSLINWLVFREAPVDEAKVILWVRTDLFTGAVDAASIQP